MLFRFLLILLLFGGCVRQELSVYTEYVSFETLPSYIIGTPDPALFCPDIGERLHIHWSEKCGNQLVLHLSLRFGDKTEDEVWLNLYSLTGTYVYSLMNEEYWAKGGIFTYKVEIFDNDELINEWRHQLWAPRITVGENVK